MHIAIGTALDQAGKEHHRGNCLYSGESPGSEVLLRLNSRCSPPNSRIYAFVTVKGQNI